MFSSIEPCVSNSAKIASNSAKSVAALIPVIPDDLFPLSPIASNKPCVPTPLAPASAEPLIWPSAKPMIELGADF